MKTVIAALLTVGLMGSAFAATPNEAAAPAPAPVLASSAEAAPAAAPAPADVPGADLAGANARGSIMPMVYVGLGLLVVGTLATAGGSAQSQTNSTGTTK